MTVLAALVLATVSSPSLTGNHCAVGAHTTLDIEVLERPKFPMHDQSIGRDRLVLRSLDGKSLFAKETDDGQWRCLGFDQAKHRYLIGFHSEVGAWLVLSSIVYLAEDGKELAASAFSRKSFLALTTLTSPRGRYVAFVGGIHVADGLYVLDTATDAIRRLDRPPAPPPLGDDDFSCPDRFEWGSCWADGYATLETDIWHFEGDDTLVVTRGKDSARRRAKKRTVHRYKL
jgi:hypothetical protein